MPNSRPRPEGVFDIENARGPRYVSGGCTLRLTIIERTVSFRCAAILQVDMPYIKPVRHISNLFVHI